ncbi:HEAT repeat domain-containing protein [Desulfosporosinus sp. BICA1-9]|uniref:HEAT repeat domain-containing protein n=1 Tax=Desulfosporosinus sp. BICA1-9 TaxID=1531958 RepID=UPI00054B37E5|nr:hypothetical protein [Desulfosporosinus sp. BICA1-9]KJS49695.1 MAG: hypothetical protein VR66_07085 [Peptococcaceae bacterium BRH_c23]KJS87444.1 MAG: hypothetical protein JL57_14085 [Desulfosporosinus sp. BICA1-9]
MREYLDKYSAHQTLIKPLKMFGFPKVKDKLAALHWLSKDIDPKDIEYVFPLIFVKNTTLALTAAQITAGIMSKIGGKDWSRIYDQVKYTRIDEKSLVSLLEFETDISVHLLGIASLNSNGYVREKALKLISGVKSPSAVPYILLRLNDWVVSVRNLAEHIIKNMFIPDNIDLFINHFDLINKLQDSVRVDLNQIKMQVEDFLKDDSFKDIVKRKLKHPQVKTRLFCYQLLKDRIVNDETIIISALQDKSFEVRMWLVGAIKSLEPQARDAIIEKLLQDKSSKVKTAVLREHEDVVCLNFRGIIEMLLVDESASVRDDARFIVKKHSMVTDIPEFYRLKILKNPLPGAIVGLGETGGQRDFDIVCGFKTNEEPKMRLASLIAMWQLSKVDTVGFVLDALNSDLPKIKKTAKRLLKKAKMPEILSVMKEKLKSEDLNTRIFALQIIYSYGGWQALLAILYAISREQEPVLSEARNILNNWLPKSTSLYSKPDRDTEKEIINLDETIRLKGLISENVIKELQFVLATRR